MDYPSLDPYEEQLLKVFDSYDFENLGSLDRDGLTQLCCTLQLEEQGNELIQHLLSDSKQHPRVTFLEFKEALLNLLGNRTQGNESQVPNDKGSPDREVSPKFVYGTKKYGRRSRPRNDEVLEELNENMNYSNKISYNTTVQRSNSQSDVVYSKKRKTNTKLKRCTSFPGSRDFDCHKKMSGPVFVTNGFSQEFVCTEEMLRKAWEKLGVGEDGYLNQTELVLVCDAIGLHRLAKGVIRQLSNKFELDAESKISFQELLEALQQDDAWSDVLSSSPTTPIDNSLNISISCLSGSVFPDPQIVQHITLGPDGTGFINLDYISEMWESVGIASPKLLLRELGFVCAQINVSELAVALEKEIKSASDLKTDLTNPHVILLQAVLTLYKSEIRCLKSILEQMHAEREKLKGDVSEANDRATMLAQEVDDNHARMELNTRNQVRVLEQRHADIIKEVTRQFMGEKEQITQINQGLEERISCLEIEEAKLRNDLEMMQESSIMMEKENHALAGEICELKQFKDVLTEQVNVLESDKQNYELENHQAKIEPLLEKLSALQIENSQLRDKNDEMVTEIESLNGQICLMRTKTTSTPTFLNIEQSMEENNVSIVCEGVGLGSKRRSDDSPSKDLNVLGLCDGSPRLGKVRKCDKTKDLTVLSSESGVDTELDSLSSSTTDYEEITKLQRKIMHLEEILRKHSIPVPENNFSYISESQNLTNEMKIRQMAERCVNLQNVILKVQKDLSKMLTLNTGCCGCETNKFAKYMNQELTNLVQEKTCCDASTETDTLSLEEQIEKYVQENQELITKCSELENCIELLRTEYERCEDYWSLKLDEERQMFEQEQSQSSEKLTELINKMAEYELQFSNNQDELDFRLPTIEEKYNLEAQFTDLEQEYEEYKEQAEFQMAEKTNEIADLKEKLQHKNTAEIGIQVEESLYDFSADNSLENKMGNLTNCLVESTNLFGTDAMPYKFSTGQTNISEQKSLDSVVSDDASEQRDYVNPTFVWDKTKVSNSERPENSDQVDFPWQKTLSLNQSPQPFSIVSLPSTSATETATDSNVTPTRPKRSRKHEKNFKVQRLNKKDESKKEVNNQINSQNSPVSWKTMDGSRVTNGEQMVSVPIGALHSLNGRLHHLEQRCRHLQVVLKQQHYHAEQMLHHCWQQYRGEKVELQYLLKNSQEKLEHQMRICNEQLERLSRTDILVKDLYVENSYLVANVQRLEKQCHILTQFHSASSSV